MSYAISGRRIVAVSPKFGTLVKRQVDRASYETESVRMSFEVLNYKVDEMLDRVESLEESVEKPETVDEDFVANAISEAITDEVVPVTDKLEESINDLEASIDELKESINDLEASIEDNNKDMRVAADRIKHLEDSIEGLKIELCTMSNRINELERHAIARNHNIAQRILNWFTR